MKSFELSPSTPAYSPLIDFIDLPNHCRVLEIGFGAATNLDELYRRGANVYGIDKNPYCVNEAHGKPYAEHLHLGTCFDIPAVFQPSKFDFIIMNSILHKVYSRTGNMEDVHRLLKMASNCLFYEGMLLFDEGLIAENGEMDIELSLSKKWNKKAKYYFENQPFGAQYDMEYLNWGKWKGTLKSVTALLHVLRKSNLDIKEKTFQFSQLASLEGFEKMLKPFGFEVEMAPYTDPVLVKANGVHYNLKDDTGTIIDCPPMSAMFKATLTDSSQIM